MNLQENINRIHQMMGVISEDKKSTIINSIKDMGLSDAIMYFGGYDRIKDYVTEEDKISYIQYKVGEIADERGDLGVSVHETGELPIFYNESDDTISQIEYFYPTFVTIETYGGYKNETYQGKFTVKYENLPDDVFDEVFDFILNLEL